MTDPLAAGDFARDLPGEGDLPPPLSPRLTVPGLALADFALAAALALARFIGVAFPIAFATLRVASTPIGMG